MSGHSKWANIKHKKEKSDSQRAKVFTKIGREMAVAIKEGGPDPAVNGKLRDLIAKAKANNVPNDNIERAIKKAAGEGNKNDYEECVYEGYGPNGVAVIVEALTDNRNRTAADVRHFFDKFGGNLGNTGCVSYLFSKKGIVVLENDGSLEEDAVMEDVMEAGAEDMDFGEEAIEIECETGAVSEVREYLADKGYTVVSAEVEQVPSTYVTLTDEDDIRKMNLLLDNLEDDDDIQNVFHNWEMPEE
ncbi:MAG TPA: YebC/PmpR family DNA-binding transcriptional regulator [Candidatus Egerieicola pullicola]|uniref:Probable transcriptional regulatory protein IAB36_06820 n=1 Tax=Candidatus Egerieicola pullicola TaxID=2840775 RepID=A0A9D1DEE6_9FIRM|nr:YebC/PmpR family DNA-binding transcriptional regulator [Candidatus Egerieicola pullicola]